MRPLARRRYTTAVSLVVALSVALLMEAWHVGRRVDAWLWDGVAARLAPPVDQGGTLVFGVDDDSLMALEPLVGAWPYRRDVWAHVLDYLREAGAAHVTVDVLFADPRDGDTQLADTLARSPAVTLAAVPVPFRVSPRGAPARPPTIGLDVPGRGPVREALDLVGPRPELQAVARLGVAVTPPDEDGIVRRLPLLTRVGTVTLPALPVASLAGLARTAAWQSSWWGTSLTLADQSVPVDRDGLVQLRYPAAIPDLPTLPFARLVQAAVSANGDQTLREAVRGRRVFIGATALLLEEAVPTPMGRIAGVEFLRLATVLLRDRAVVRPRTWLLDVGVLGMALGVLLASRLRRSTPTRALLLAWMAAWLLVLGIAAVLLLAAHQRVWLHGPLAATAAAAATIAVGDLARVRRDRARLAQERLAAERASELKTQFLNHIAHELRTPVTAILGFGRLIIEGRDAGDPREYARVITRNGAHLLQLVNNLLDDATLAVGRARIDPQPVDMRQVVSDALATVEGLPRHEDVALSGDVATDVPAYVLVDALRVRQILLNLLANAMKFTEVGRIHLAVAWQADGLVVTVRDTGTGMSADALDRVFEEFEFATARAVRAGGTGLGLSVSRRLARLMGGDLTAESIEGRGSCFTLTLPTRSADAPPEATRPDDDGEDGDADGPLVLICDDVEDIRQLFAVVLAAAGARVVTASSGREAVALAVAIGPDVVLLDLDLGDQDGLTTADQLREAGYAGPLIAVSGSGEDRSAALRARGFADAARKPVSTALLVDLVARQVRRWQPRRPDARD